MKKDLLGKTFEMMGEEEFRSRRSEMKSTFCFLTQIDDSLQQIWNAMASFEMQQEKCFILWLKIQYF